MKRIVLAALLVHAAIGQTAMGQSSTTPAAPPTDDPSTSLQSLLDTKVVTASRFAENLADAPGVITIVSRDEIDRFGGLSLREILNRVAGLNFATNSITDHTIVSARGDQSKSDSSHILFLINGRPTREVLEGGIMTELLEAFPIGILERIEVIEGPGSVLYGSNAYSGVINLITRKATGQSLTLRGYGAGGAGPSGGSGEAFFQRGDLAISAAAQYRTDPKWATPLWPDLTPVPSWQTFSLYDQSRSLFVEAGYKGFSAMAAVMEDASPSAIAGLTTQTNFRRKFFDVGYDAKPHRRWNTGFHATYTRNGMYTVSLPYFEQKAGELVVDWTNSLAIGSRDQVTFGATYSYQHAIELSSSGSPPAVVLDAHRSGISFYAQWEHQLFDSLKLIGGFQTVKFGDAHVHTVPRAGVIWNPWEHWYAKVLYGQAFRAPSLTEAYNQSPGLLGNPALHPEVSTNLDLELIYQSNRLRTSFSVFRNHQSNDIVSLPLSLITFQFANAGGLTIEGAQWQTKYYFRSHFFAEGSALLQGNNNDLPIPVPAFGAKAGLGYSERRGWTFGVFDVYSGLIPNYAATPNPKPAAYHLLSANVRLGLEKYLGAAGRNVTLFAHGDNLANRPVWLPAWGFGSNPTFPVERGRTMYYGVEVSFKRD